MEQNNELRTAWDFVENTGRSIFLTGKAGTGKTTFLKTVFEKSRKRPIVVAPTGVAAINAGGVTIHSFFQLPFSPYVPGAKVESKFDFSREKRKIIASIDLLIIDEISMVRADLLDAIDNVLRRFRNHSLPFGGVQLLMIGDLQQLTPVVTSDEEQLLRSYYDTPYFFGSKALQQIDYVTIQLTHVYRQQDESFIEILNEVRNGHPSQETLEKLNSRSLPQPPPKGGGAIRLTTHNNLANFYNESELEKLPGSAIHYRAEVKGTFPEYSYPTAETLVLKVGAQVMFVKNDPSGEHKFYNGLIGKVVEATEKSLTVYCAGDSEAIEVEPLEWENTRYTLNEKTREIETEVQGTFKQLPLRLAWAITIHKSQGLTFDRAIIDANQSFAPGQVYVALSRCRTLEGLALASPLTARSIINDERVDSYIAQQETEAQRSIEQLPLLKQEYERYLLLQLFDFRPLLNQQETMVRIFAEYFYHSNASLKQLQDQTLQDLRLHVISVAEKWQQKIRQMSFEALREAEFLERVKRSAEYFADMLYNILSKPLELTAKVETNNKQAARRLDSALADERQTWLSLRYLLMKIAERGYTVSIYLKEKQHAMLNAIEEGEIKPKRQRKRKTNLLILCALMLLNSLSAQAEEEVAYEHGGDRYVINVAALTPDKQMTLMDVLQTCPELLSEDGKRLHSDYEIRVDNVGLLLDDATILEALKADEISRIEIYLSTSVAVGGAGRSGIIDIYMKKPERDTTSGKLLLEGSSSGCGKAYVDILTRKGNITVRGYALTNLEYTRATLTDDERFTSRQGVENLHLNIDWDISENDNLKIKLSQNFLDGKLRMLTDDAAVLPEMVRNWNGVASYSRALNERGATLLVESGANYQNASVSGIKIQDWLAYYFTEASIPLLSEDLSMLVGWEIDYDNLWTTDIDRQQMMFNDFYLQFDYSRGPWLLTLGDRFRIIKYWHRSYVTDDASLWSNSRCEHSYLASVGYRQSRHFLQALFSRDYSTPLIDFLYTGYDSDHQRNVYATDYKTHMVYSGELRYSYQQPHLTVTGSALHSWTDNGLWYDSRQTGVRASATWHSGALRLTAGADYCHEQARGDVLDVTTDNYFHLRLLPTLQLPYGLRLTSRLQYNSRRRIFYDIPSHFCSSVKLSKELGRHFTLSADFHDLTGSPRLGYSQMGSIYDNRGVTIELCWRR